MSKPFLLDLQAVKLYIVSYVCPVVINLSYLHILAEVQSIFSGSEQSVKNSLLHLLPLNQHGLAVVLFSQQERLSV